MRDDASRLDELARAEYERFTQETNPRRTFQPAPAAPPIPPSKAKKRKQVGLLVFLILLDLALLLFALVPEADAARPSIGPHPHGGVSSSWTRSGIIQFGIGQSILNQ